VKSDPRVWLAGAIVTLALLTPRASHACAVCFSSRNEAARESFTITTVFLTALPLVMIGGAVWWLRRRARLLEQGGAPLARKSAEPGPAGWPGLFMKPSAGDHE
jgi:hypothetical protein